MNENSTFLVTGASSGIGRALAVQLAAPERNILLLGRDESRLNAVAAEVRKKGANAQTKTLDITDFEAVDHYFREEVGDVDEVYLSAARSIFGEVKDLQIEDWETIYKTNFLSWAQWVHEFHRRMVARRGGRIVILSSLAGYTGYPGCAPYAAAKAGLTSLFRTMWHEGRAHGVNYHLVSPGYVRTGIYEAAIFRGIDYGRVSEMLDGSGFKMMEPEGAAREILREISANRKEIIFPGYARTLAGISMRFPWLMGPVRKSMVDLFRRFAVSGGGKT